MNALFLPRITLTPIYSVWIEADVGIPVESF